MAKKKVNKLEDSEEVGHAPTSILESLGITVSNNHRERQYAVYKLKWHPLATIDHSKFPWARWVELEDSPMFATWQKANTQCKKLEKQFKDRMYSTYSIFLSKSQIPAKVLKEILELPYYRED